MLETSVGFGPPTIDKMPSIIKNLELILVRDFYEVANLIAFKVPMKS